MPLERIFGSKEKLLSPEELKARKEEENLFSELPQLPTTLSRETYIPENNLTDDTEMESSLSAKKRRINK